ncbi:hypothetical protein Aple_099200 [Acrocarpospora pleiomorpha]|uniref:Uncharacterized protein n=1 Tax=Acrocarpospora pleiomorpha TaxID=90975 RepID=A0A5M3Y4Z2_9ACTN|nr:hypothetical protein [Acrocarpospora pleiomorpha]GES27021.1 hypothetical protein Aple_099200 [Acrocarpospora pleiomorpha]
MIELARTLEACAAKLSELADRLHDDPAAPPWFDTTARAYATRCHQAATDLTAASQALGDRV